MFFDKATNKPRRKSKVSLSSQTTFSCVLSLKSTLITLFGNKISKLEISMLLLSSYTDDFRNF